MTSSHICWKKFQSDEWPMGRADFLRKTMGGTGLRFTAHGLVFSGPTRPIETSDTHVDFLSFLLNKEKEETHIFCLYYFSAQFSQNSGFVEFSSRT